MRQAGTDASKQPWQGSDSGGLEHTEVILKSGKQTLCGREKVRVKKANCQGSPVS